MLKPDSLLALRFVRDAQLSPDAAWVAQAISRTTSETEFCEIGLQNLQTGEEAPVCVGDVFAMSPRWSRDGSKLAFVIDGGLRVYDTASAQTAQVLPSGWGLAGAPAWSPDGRSVAVSHLKVLPTGPVRHITKRVFRMEGLGFIDDFEHGLHVVDIASGETRKVADGDGPYVKPSFSPCGRRLLFLATPADVGAISPFLFVAPSDGGPPKAVTNGDWYVESAQWAPDGERIVILGDFKSKVTVPVCKLWTVRADGTGEQLRSPTLSGHVGLRAHHDMPNWFMEGGAPYFMDGDAVVTVQARGRAGVWRIALDGPERCEQLVGGDRTCTAMGAGGKLLFVTHDISTPTEIAVADPDGSNERRITDLNSAVMADWPKLTATHLQFKSTDGLEIEGWNVARADLTGPQPTVYYIHGGPFLATGHMFRFDTHLLASNGISVLGSNFRGSTGYGEHFSEAIVGDWGSRGFPDHMATVDAAIAAGLADPKKLGVWGHSHGGFATTWIVGHTDRFVAAVAEAAVTSMETVYYLSDLPDGFTREFGGAKFRELPDLYRSRSPLTYAWRCRTPIRMIHGANDVRCVLAEAEQFHRAVMDAGCESQMVIIAGCDHMGDSMGPVSARVAQNEALLSWLVQKL
jgi:dipeptidyl aminopeptidase/acylaminoacyl peptidase